MGLTLASLALANMQSFEGHPYVALIADSADRPDIHLSISASK